MVTLTGNQPHALEAARRADGRERRLGWRSVRSGTGEPDRRSIRTAPADDSRFPGARQVFRIRRGVGDLDNLWTTKEIVYGIASLLASPNTSGCYERQHWTVGNRLHWTRDVTSHENFPQLRTSTAARALASCRNLAINTFRLAGRANIADARRDLHSHDDVVTVYASNPQQSNRTKSQRRSPGFVSDR